MNTHLRSLIMSGCATLALLAIGVLAVDPAAAASARRESNGAIRFYDDNGFDRGYAWCLKRGGRTAFGGSGSDCSYFSYAQCRAAIFNPPGGDCEPNPFAAYVPPPPTGRLRR